MGKYSVAGLLLLLLSLTSLIPSLACPSCPHPTPPKKSPPPPKPCPPPPPPKPKPIPPPSPPKPTPCPPPPKAPASCPIDTLKLSACVDLLAGAVHIGLGPDVKKECCPVLQGLADVDAALCLCTTIKAKLLDVKILLPIALELLVDCGKYPPKDYQCPA